MITVMVATLGAVPLFKPIKLAILPVPDAARPMLVLLFVQLYTAVPPIVGVLKITSAVLVLAHTVWLGTGFTTGDGFTVMVNVVGVPTQFTPPLV